MLFKKESTPCSWFDVWLVDSLVEFLMKSYSGLIRPVMLCAVLTEFGMTVPRGVERSQPPFGLPNILVYGGLKLPVVLQEREGTVCWTGTDPGGVVEYKKQ